MPISNTQMAARRKGAYSRRGQSITLMEFVSKDFDPATGETQPTYTNRTIQEALVWDLTTTALLASEGRYKVQDKSCRILMSQLPSTSRPPTKECKIVISSVTYSIIDINVSGDNQAVTLILRVP